MPKRPVHAFLNGARQGHHLGATGSTTVHQDQCLLLIHPGAADGFAFQPQASIIQPAASLKLPSGKG